MHTKYEILINVLDTLCKEAPDTETKYKFGKTENHRNINTFTEKLNQSRSRAYIHLYLKVKFGIASFQEREKLITDGSNDGGIDAYYIDVDNKTIHLIQSKFRTTEHNFEVKSISPSEITKMDIDEIVKGETKNENGVEYNQKIKELQGVIYSTQYLSQYKWKIVILANCCIFESIQKMYKDYQIEVFDFQRSYKELVFPVVSGTHFKADDINIKVRLDNTNLGHSRVAYSTIIDNIEVDVMVLFAPTSEIGRVMYLYRNSLLEFNPRSFLGLSTGSVNDEIRSAITKSEDNRFALFNNGITIVADEAGYSDKTGKNNVATLVLIAQTSHPKPLVNK